MGLREVILLGFGLLWSGGNLCFGSQNTSINTTFKPREHVEAGLLQTAAHQSNKTEQSERPHSPVSYRLRSYRLKKPAASAVQQKTLQLLVEQMQGLQNLQGSDVKELTPELQELGDRVQAQSFTPRALVPGPDLNPPVRESKAVVMFEQQVPAPADSVAVHCADRGVDVEVKQDFLGNGQLIHPDDLTLGGCAALDTMDHILQFHSVLHGCGSTVKMTEEALIYTFSLMYSPATIGSTSIFKTNPAEVLIECHYQRRHYVSSDALKPSWKPFASDVLAEQQLHFSLRLMTEDWQSQNPSSVYFLNDVLYIEASVLEGHHIPLRLYVDNCVATLDPDPGSEPRYSFINNHGCLADSKLMGAKSYFMQRSQEDKLHFQLKVFRFHRDHRNSKYTSDGLSPSSKMYITCRLKATAMSVPIDSRHKACSYIAEANRWVATEGDNKVCSCCESSCGEQRRTRSLAADADLQWEGTAALGPVLLQQRILQQELVASSKLPLTQATQTPRLQILNAAPLFALICGLAITITGVLLASLVVVTCYKVYKPTVKAYT